MLIYTTKGLAMRPLIIIIAIALLMSCAGPEPVRDIPYDYDTDDYAQSDRVSRVNAEIMEVS